MAAYDRAQLAIATADALSTLNLEERDASTELVERLLAAGILPTMHAENVVNETPLRSVRVGLSPWEALEAARHNLSVAVGTVVVMETWPRDMRIEYELGQIIAALQQPISYMSETRSWARTEMLKWARAQLRKLASAEA